MLVVALLALLSLCSAGLAPLVEPEFAEIISGSYIVVYKDETPADVFAKDVLVAVQQYEVVHQYTTVLKGYAAKMTDAQVEAVRALPFVSFIEKDQVMYTTDCGTTVKYGSWGQTRVAEKGKTSWNELYAAPTDAKDIDIYVVDTGIYVENVDFDNRAKPAFRADSKWSNTDANGHGTHVASTSGGRLYGIAQAANLWGVKVLGDDGYGTNAGVIAGVDFAVSDAITRGANKAVINMSLGGGKSAALDASVNAAVAQNVVVVVAAGNDDANACNGSPSGASAVLTVGSTEQGIPGGKDGRSWFSNWGTCVQVFAPGTSIRAAWKGTPTATNTISGTSMASPHVAGIAALLRAQYPALSAAAIQQQIAGSATAGNLELLCTVTGTCVNSPNLVANNGCDIAK